MNLLNHKKSVSYVSLVLPVLAVILAIVGASTRGLVRDTFPGSIVLFLIVGAVVTVAGFLLNQFDFINALSPIFYGLALGLIFKGGVEVLMYALIGIDNNVGGQASLTLAYLILGVVLFLASVVIAFFDHSTEKK